MKRWLKPLQWLYCIYAFVAFVAIMLVIFPFAVLASFLGKIKGGNLVLRLCMLWADAWFALVFIHFRRIYEVPHDKTRSFIFLSNHISYLDAAVIVKAYRQPFRPLGKAEMKKIPVFGFIYNRTIVSVHRSNPNDRANSVRLLKSITRKGISVLVFPEGTFNMTSQPLKEFYDGAFRVAIETQIPLKPVLFPDNYDRMNYRSVFSLNPGRCRIIYLAEIPVEGLTLADMGKLKKQTFDIMSEKLREYNASWISEEPILIVS